MLSLNSEQKFDKIRWNFGKLLTSLCKSLTSKPVSVDDLKNQIAFSFCDLEEEIEHCTAIVKVMSVLQKSNYCSFANCVIAEWLVENFELHDMEEELKAFHELREEYYSSIMLEDFFQEAKDCIGKNRKVDCIIIVNNYALHQSYAYFILGCFSSQLEERQEFIGRV